MSTEVPRESVLSPFAAAGIGGARLAFAVLGGAAAWTFHLLVIAIIAEWGYFAGTQQREILGITAVAFWILAATAAAVLGAAAATWVSHRLYSQIASHDGLAGSPTDADPERTFPFLATTAVISNWVFLFIIAAQAIPVFFYLTE